MGTKISCVRTWLAGNQRATVGMLPPSDSEEEEEEEAPKGAAPAEGGEAAEKPAASTSKAAAPKKAVAADGSDDDDSDDDDSDSSDDAPGYLKAAPAPRPKKWVRTGPPPPRPCTPPSNRGLHGAVPTSPVVNWLGAIMHTGSRVRVWAMLTLLLSEGATPYIHIYSLLGNPLTAWMDMQPQHASTSRVGGPDPHAHMHARATSLCSGIGTCNMCVHVPASYRPCAGQHPPRRRLLRRCARTWNGWS